MGLVLIEIMACSTGGGSQRACEFPAGPGLRRYASATIQWNARPVHHVRLVRAQIEDRRGDLLRRRPACVFGCWRAVALVLRVDGLHLKYVRRDPTPRCLLRD